MRATLHYLNGVWLAVPELNVDILFGLCSPNTQYIEAHGLQIVSDFSINNSPQTKFTENRIIVGSIKENKFQFSYFEINKE
jgi:hypothetical protein